MVLGVMEGDHPGGAPRAPQEGRACLSLGDQWKGTISMRTK